MSISLPEVLKELADQNRWVAWYDQDGRKIPKSVKTGNAKTNDPDTWGTFEQAAKTMDYKRYTGVGVMLGDGLIDQAPTRKSAHPEPACTSSPRPTRKPSA